MSPAMTRRGLVQAAGAALGAAALPAMAEAGIPASHPDADLFALLDRWREARAAWDAMDLPVDEAHERAKAAYPPRPAVLWSRGDHHYHLDAEATGRDVRPSGHLGSFYRPGDVEKLRASPRVTRWARVADDHPEPHPREPDPEGEARRQEIITAHDRWWAERKAVEDATGYTAATERFVALGTVWDGVDDALRLCQPRTVVGMVRKAAWVADCLSTGIGHDDLGAVFAGQVAAFGGAS